MSKSSKPSMSELEHKLQYHFKDQKLLAQALTHRSCKSKIHNERLEFLGDAVLDLIVGEYLFKKFPKLSEGDLSKLRACIVNEQGFNKLALALELGKYIFISPSEESNNGRSKPSILSNTFEALIGAVYLESGLQEATRITHALLESNYNKIDFGLVRDFKTSLQELTQARFMQIPRYELISESGPDHQKSFTIAIFIDGREYARCSGSSKKNAQQKCAQVAYEILQKECV